MGARHPLALASERSPGRGQPAGQGRTPGGTGGSSVGNAAQVQKPGLGPGSRAGSGSWPPGPGSWAV